MICDSSEYVDVSFARRDEDTIEAESEAAFQSSVCKSKILDIAIARRFQM
jgi:hypothetical protein